MKNNELWENYTEYTRAVTENARKLGFAAAAVCWFFKAPDNTFPGKILLALAFVVAYFCFDILQFLLGAVFLRCWTRTQERFKWKHTGRIDGNYDKPAWLDWPSYTMWWLKILALLLAFMCIGIHIWFIVTTASQIHSTSQLESEASSVSAKT